MNYNRISRPRHVLAGARTRAHATPRDFKRDSDIRIEFWFRWDFYDTKQNAVELKSETKRKEERKQVTEIRRESDECDIKQCSFWLERLQ